MEVKANIKQLFNRINLKQQINDLMIMKLNQNKYLQANLYLLKIIYNRSLKNSIPPKQYISEVQLFQKLSLIIQPLANIDPQLRLIAQFNKLQFIDYCNGKSGDQYKILQQLKNKFFGIIPYMKKVQNKYIPKLIQFQYSLIRDSKWIGNKNYQLTRKIYLIQKKKSQQELFQKGIQLILGQQSMIPRYEKQSRLERNCWKFIWSQFYYWAYHLSINNQQTTINLNSKLKKIIAEWQEYIESDKPNYLGFLLIKYILDNLFMQISSQNILLHVTNQYLQYYIQQIKNQQQIILFTVLLRQILINNGMTQTAQKCQQKLNLIKKSLTNSASQELTFYVIPKQQKIPYVVKYNLPFWNYGFDQKAHQQISVKFLNLYKSFTFPLQRQKVFSFLPASFIKQQIFLNEQWWKDNSWAYILAQTISRQPLRIQQQLREIFGQIQTSIIRHYFEQWILLMNIKKENKIGNNYEILSFCLQPHLRQDKQKLQKLIFPQQSKYFKQILQLFISTLTNNNSQQFLKSQQAKIFYEKSTIDNIIEQQSETMWYNFNNILLYKQDFIQALIQMGIQQYSQIQQKLSSKQQSSVQYRMVNSQLQNDYNRAQMIKQQSNYQINSQTQQ